MKQYLIIYIILQSIFSAYSQGEVNLGKDSNASKSGGIITACHKISLQPGFSFKAETSKSLNLKLTPSTCDPFDGKDMDEVKAKGQNYIRTKIYLRDDQTRYLDEIQYFDGLGRPIQTIQRGFTPSAKDMVTYQEYDEIGRTSRIWLPGAMSEIENNGQFVSYSSVIEKSKITNKDDHPYSLSVYEESPLNRIQKQFGPGGLWSESPVETVDLTNSQTGVLACFMYIITGTRQAPTLGGSKNYDSGKLYVTKNIDESKNVSYEFRDRQGKIILTRQISDNKNHDTYYVYDDYGNLCFVLPPMVEGQKDAATLSSLAFQYRYDDRNLCIWKKLPGCEPIYYVYDKADRVILSQDGEQRENNKNDWSFIKYDNFGRVILTGIAQLEKKLPHSSLLATYKNVFVKENIQSGSFYGYTWNTLGEVPYSAVLTANYYDDIDTMLNISSDLKTKLSYIPKSTYGTKHTSSKGLLVGTRVKYTDGNGNIGGEIATAMYYDIKGQLIQTQSTNHLGGTESEYVSYNFTGQPIHKQHVHKYPGKVDQTEIYTYEYDHAGRLLATTHKLNTGAAVILAQNTYDDLGRLKSTTANNQSALTTNYSYNVRSWTKSISNPLFSQTLSYNLNGNIKTQEWVQNNKKLTYQFTYDGLSQLTKAQYTGDGNFSTSYTYDKHGNITKLTRDGLTAASKYGTIDSLSFDYKGTGNQVKYITDLGPNVDMPTSSDFKQNKNTTKPYTYNTNGAMDSDPNKGLSIQYNSLNLPQEMAVNNVSARGKNFYTYTATGAKLQVKHWSDPTLQTVPVLGTANEADYRNKNTTDYIGNKIYENGVLNKTLIDNGYIERNNYYFYIKDHLGNNRIVASATGSVIQRNNYYPFGMSFGEESGEEQGKQNFKYNGKELDKQHGLNQYDYDARFMDPSMIRFTTVDPKAEKYYNLSPYAYVGNNPLRFIDPTGMVWDDPNVAYKLKKNIDKKIETLNNNIEKNELSLAKGGHSEKKTKNLEKQIAEAKSRISNLNISKNDIDKLGADKNNTYAINNTSGGKHFVRQGSDGKVYIESSSDALSIHEISHVRQSLEAGGLKFTHEGLLLNSGSGLKGKSNIEVESYQLQYSVDQTFPGKNHNGIQGIDIHSVGNIKDDNQNYVYPIIKEYSEAVKRALKINNK